MITVIGAGPAGCYYASKVKNEEVTIIEEHKEVGKPVACTGILTNSVDEMIKIPKNAIVSRLKQFKITSPDGKSIYLKLRKPDYIVDRAKFDKHISDLAFDNGAKILLGEKFVGYKDKNKEYSIKTDKKTYNSNILVGADGPFSNVAKASGIYGDRKFVRGWQVRCKYPDLEEETTEIKLGLGEFSWITPEDDKVARVGMVGSDLNKMNKDFSILRKNAKIIEHQSGAIPLYNPKQQIRKRNVFLIGDAATHTKATTYGGIVYGLKDAGYLAQNPGSYVKKFKKGISKELWIGLQLRKILNKMGYRDFNKLMEIFDKDKNKQLIESSSRDYPSRFILKLLKNEPKLSFFGLKLLLR